MEEITYKVYAKVNEQNLIQGIESTAFHAENELLENGYVLIDKGTNGRIYGHAQPNYLREKYGQPTFDEQFRNNYKLNGTTPHLLTDEEKEELFKPQPPEPTEQEQFNAMILMELAKLKAGV